MSGKSSTYSPSADLEFTHFGMYVFDINTMSEFYMKALGFTKTDHGVLNGREVAFLSRNPSEHHQIVMVSGRPQELTFNPINQISMRVADLTSLRRYHDRVIAYGASDIEPVSHGNAISVYCRDPEQNKIELYIDTPWYCEQPLREAIDLRDSDFEILRKTEDLARQRPNFVAREVWEKQMVERMKSHQSD
jgi:catechol 2,3-dioxygenase